MSSTKKWSRKSHSIWEVNDEATPMLASNNASKSYIHSYEDDFFIKKLSTASKYEDTCRFHNQIKVKLNWINRNSYQIVSSPQVESKLQNVKLKWINCNSYQIVSSSQVERKFQNINPEGKVQNKGSEIKIQNEDYPRNQFLRDLNKDENICPICRNPLRSCPELVITTCGHLYCGGCSKALIAQTYPKGFTCSMCRQYLNSKDMITPKI